MNNKLCGTMRKVFFSFHYENDAWRAAIVRNSWITQGEEAGFIDKVDWEEVKRQGDQYIKNWIDKNLEGTSVTVVLIGSQTKDRKWVNYEIEKSYERGNGIVGIHIHKIKDQNKLTSLKGDNPLVKCVYDVNGEIIFLNDIYNTYDWVMDDGYNNMGKWIDEAASIARN